MNSDIKREVDITQREAVKLQKAGAKVSIKSREDLIEATGFLAKVKQFNRAIAAKKKAIIGPLRVAIKEVNDQFADAELRGSMLENNVKTAMLEYQQKVDDLAAKKAARLEKQLDEGKIDMSTAAGKLSRIEQAPVSLKTEDGGVQFRTIRKLRITNLSDIPSHYWLRPAVVEAIEAEVRHDVLKDHKPCPAGAEVYEEKVVAGTS